MPVLSDFTPLWLDEMNGIDAHLRKQDEEWRAHTGSLPAPHVLITPNSALGVSAVARVNAVAMNGQEQSTIVSNIPLIASLW